MDKETQTHLSEHLVGASLRDMENLGAYLQLLIGSCRLVLGSAWRIMQRGELVVGSGDPDELVEQGLRSLLLGQAIQSVTTVGAFHDLQIVFADGSVLESFADAADYESWNLAVGTGGEMIVAGPGRSWAVL